MKVKENCKYERKIGKDLQLKFSKNKQINEKQNQNR